MIDTHAHLFYCKRSVEALVENAKKAHLSGIINVAVDIKTAKMALEMHKQFPDFIFPTLGVHPSESNQDIDWSEFENLYKNNPFKAIGEIGLDYFKLYEPKEIQMKVFLKQMELAKKLGAPVIIHNRHADEDMIEISNMYPDLKKVFHCFSSSMEFANSVINKNTFFSFTGTITYSKKGKTINALREIPLENIMIETDCPWLSPVNFKDEENQPSFVSEIASKIAKVKDIDIKVVIEQTTKNAKSFFHI